jgi:hypothetical protein
MDAKPLVSLTRLSLSDCSSLRRARPIDFDDLVADFDTACEPSARQRRRMNLEPRRWKRKRVTPCAGGAQDNDMGAIDDVARLMHKRLRVTDRSDRLADTRKIKDDKGCDLFTLLPDELVLAVMGHCDVRSLGRLACASARLAGLAADNVLWKALYNAAAPPACPIACLAQAVDAWCFAVDGTGAADGLDHGPSQLHGTHAVSRDVPGRDPHDDDGPLILGPWSSKAASHKNADDDDFDSAHLKNRQRWWANRCMRFTRMAIDRATGCGGLPGHPNCPHPPPSLVRACGYRWAYAAVVGLAPLVRKIHRGHGHTHIVVHRGAYDGLGFQSETCHATGAPCHHTWRWGRFARGCLSGLGTESMYTWHPMSSPEAVGTVVAMWVDGEVRGVAVRRVGGPAATFVVGDANIALDRQRPDSPDGDHRQLMEQDPIPFAGQFESDDGTVVHAGQWPPQRESESEDEADAGAIVSTSNRSTVVVHYALDQADADAWSYSGERLANKRQGFGRFACESMPLPLYEGEWRDDRWHGRGVLRAHGPDSTSVTFTGRFVCGRPCGRGILAIGDGLRIEASWHTLPNGRVGPRHAGHIIYANGDRAFCRWEHTRSPGSCSSSKIACSKRSAPTDNIHSRSDKDDNDDNGGANHCPNSCDVDYSPLESRSVAVDRPTAKTLYRVVVKGFRFAPRAVGEGASEFAGREVGAEWGPWPTDHGGETIFALQPQHCSLPSWCGGDRPFCVGGWAVVLPTVFWPPTAHPLEPLFGRYVDQERIGWRGWRAEAPRTLGAYDPCAEA